MTTDREDKTAQTLWLLNELANFDDIDSDEIEILGEDETGRDAYCTAKITDIAMLAIEAIEGLKK